MADDPDVDYDHHLSSRIMSRKWIIPSRKLTAAHKPNARIFLPKHGLRGLANECVTLRAIEDYL